MYEKINQILLSKGMSKKFFAQRLIEMAPILKSTGERPSLSAIYSYLNGSREIRIELISYISEILGITEQELFDENETKRLIFLSSILKNPSQKEIKKITQWCESEFFLNSKQDFSDSSMNYIVDLLPFAPKEFLYKLTGLLEDFKITSVESLKNLKK
jgi:transcriptional regulator with XRE-family HTH domain